MKETIEIIDIEEGRNPYGVQLIRINSYKNS